MRKLSQVGSLAVAAVVVLGPWLPGCADRDESREARLERLEARLDRLDDRLTRVEARPPATATDAAGHPGTYEPGGIDPGRLESALGNMDPERRARLRKRFAGMRRRMDKLREGADLNAKPGTPEFRRGLLLEMMRQQNPAGGLGRRGDGENGGAVEEQAATDEPDTPAE